MDTLKLDNNNDLCLCSMENLATISGLQSVQQTAENKVKAVCVLHPETARTMRLPRR